MTALKEPPRAYRIGSQFAWISAGRLLAAGLQALTVLALIRVTAPADFGLFSAVYGTIIVVQVLFDFGLPTLVIRERAQDRESRIVPDALRANTVTSIVMCLVITAVLLVLGLAADSRFLLLMPLGLWAAAERNADTWLGAALADGDARLNTANLVARRVALYVLFIAAGFLVDVSSLLLFSSISALVAVGSWIAARRVVSKRLPEPSRTTVSRLLGMAWPYWLNSVATQARNLDSAIVIAAAGPVQGAFYSASARLTGPLRILPTSLASAILPASSRKEGALTKRVIGVIIASVSALSLIYVLIAVVVPFVAEPLLGVDYVDSVPSIQIVLLSLTFAAAASMMGALLQGRGDSTFVASSSVVATTVCLVGVLIGATAFGSVGAAVGLGASYIAQALTLLTRLIIVLRKEAS